MLILQGREMNIGRKFYPEEDESALRDDYLNCIISKGADKSKLEEHIEFYDNNKLLKKYKERIYIYMGN